MKTKTPAREAHDEMKPADAAALVECLLHDVNFDSDILSRILLLLHWMAYKAEWPERDSLCTEAETLYAGYILGTDVAVAAQMRRQFDMLRKGGAKG